MVRVNTAALHRVIPDAETSGRMMHRTPVAAASRLSTPAIQCAEPSSSGTAAFARGGRTTNSSGIASRQAMPISQKSSR